MNIERFEVAKADKRNAIVQLEQKDNGDVHITVEDELVAWFSADGGVHLSVWEEKLQKLGIQLREI